MMSSTFEGSFLQDPKPVQADDAIFGHGVASRAPSARTPATEHYLRALALDEECWGGSGIRESFVNRRHHARLGYRV